MEILRLGSVDLNNGMTTWIGRETDMGVPQVLTTSIARLLTDGEIVTGLRSGNRQLQIPVQIMASTRAAAVAIEAAIVAQVNEAYSPLLWEPTGGEPTVFDCFRGSVQRDWSILESRAGRISLTITIPALPFARTFDPVDLVPTVVTAVTLDSFDAVSGSRTNSYTGAEAEDEYGFPVANAGVFSHDTVNKSQGTASLLLTGVRSAVTGSTVDALIVETDLAFAATDLSDYPAVLLDWVAEPNPPGNPNLSNGLHSATSTWTLTLRSASGTSTWVVTQPPVVGTWQSVAWQIAQAATSTTGTFDLTAVTGSHVKWAYHPLSPAGINVRMDYLRAQPSNGLNITTASGTARLDGVLGTARTPVDLSVVTNAGTANRLLIARYPNPPGNFDPILSAVDGATTAASVADATAIAGVHREPSGAQFIRYTRSATSLDGTYTVLGRLRGDFASGTRTVTVTAYISTDSTGAPQAVTRTFTTTDLPPVGSGGAWQLVTIGQITLPPRDVPSNSIAIVNIDVTTSEDIRVDQLYLVDTAGDSVLIDTVTRSFSRWLLSAPDPSGQRGTVLAGTVADGSDFLAVTPWLTGQPILNLDPGMNLVLVVADKADTGVGVQVIYYPRYHSEVLP